MSITDNDKIGSLIIQELGLIRIALEGKVELAEKIASLQKRLSSPEEGSKEARTWLCNLTGLSDDTTWEELIKELCRIEMKGAEQITSLTARVRKLEQWIIDYVQEVDDTLCGDHYQLTRRGREFIDEMKLVKQ